MYKLKVIIKIGSTDYDVSNYLDASSIQIQDRADWTFERGSFSFNHPTLTWNIPPYSLCKFVEQSVTTETISDGNGNSSTTTTITDVNTSYYLISSKASQNLIQNITIHDCSLLSLDALLECYILGSKAYTYETDYNVITKTLTLINNKYNCYFTLENLYNDPLLLNQNDYTFGTGTTLYEVVRQVANKNNIKFNVYFDSFSGDVYSGAIKIIFYNPSSTAALTIDNNSNELMSLRYMQEPENYCKYLETEASNVVDRDKNVTWKDITCRTTYYKFDSDHAEILLPTNVESITGFKVKGKFNLTIDMKIPTIATSDWIYAKGGHPDGPAMVLEKTYQQLIDTNTAYGTTTDNVFQFFYDEILKYCPNILSASCEIRRTSTGVTVTIGSDNKFTNDSYVADFSSQIVEEAEFSTIQESDKPKYPFYKTGTNVIQNLYGHYRDDLWGLISQNTTRSFLEEGLTVNASLDTLNYCQVSITASGSIGLEIIPANYSYEISAIPITNPRLIDTKNASPDNETSFKNMGRSYQLGNNNGMLTYFDALVEDMDKQNETLGQVEAMVEIDTSKYIIPENNQTYPVGTKLMPVPNQPVTLFNNTFYISSLIHIISPSRRVTQLNLTKTPYKIADAIGVDYQFNSLKIPMQGIVDRGIYVELTNSSWRSAARGNNQIFLYCRFYGTYGSSYSYELAKRCAISIDSNGDPVLYCEALDNYSFDRAIDNNECYDAPYVASNGTALQLTMKLYIVDSLTIADSKKLPDASAVTGALNYITILDGAYIYKDTRERLTFTIKIKNS